MNKTLLCFRDGKWHADELANLCDKFERELNESKRSEMDVRQILTVADEERDAALAQVAAMREALIAWQEWYYDAKTLAAPTQLTASALSSGAGKDFVHKNEVEKAYLEDWNDSFSGDEFKSSEDYKTSCARRVVEG
jgi:hypothetical protein